jgi:transposase-like protein
MESGDSDVLKEGYATEGEYRWICKQCFEDFREEYKWTVSNNAV